MTTLLDLVKHYQYCIEKHPQDEEKVLRAIDKLFNLDVKVQHLQDTGVGRTVNALRKEPGMVGKAARALVYKWKLMVANEESDQEEDHNDISTQNGSEKDSDEGQHNRSRSHRDYKQQNGNHSGSKRKYHSSEEEGPDTKKSRHSHSSESEDYKGKHLQPKTEPESDSQTSDSHSESDSESESSEEERKPVKIKTEPEDKPSNSKYATTNYSKNMISESSSSKRSHEPSEQNGSKHSKHSSDSRHSSDKSSKSTHSSRDKEQTSDKKHSSEKYHKTDKEKSKEKVESKSSIKNSSEKHKSSSHKTESSSDRHKEQEKSKSDKYSSSKLDKEKHKSSSEKEDKQKSKESSSSKEKSSSSKERTKDRSSSSKEKSKSSSSSHSKSEKKQSTSSDKSDKSKSENRSKSDKSEETSNEKKSSHRSSSSHKHSSSSSKSKEDKPKKNVTINTDSDEDGIGCESGASFAEALGMVLPAKSKKKQSTTPIKDAFSPNTTTTTTTSGNDSPLSLLNPHARLAPLPALEISALPDISPNYKPRPPPKCIPHFTEEELGAAITSKNLRTKVYSGNKIIGKIPSLYDMCVQVLQEHIDALEYTGGVPYEILKPVVDKATPQQLFMLEHYNPYLMEDTDHLWQKHCEKLFRNKKRQEMETWREMFMRCQEEQENKLKSLTANIKLTQEAKKAPIKQTKMAYVDSVVKPPRNVARKQAQHGTAHAATASPAARVASLAAQPNVLRGGVRAPPAPPTSASSFNKPKKAPLMAKALQLMRGRKR